MIGLLSTVLALAAATDHGRCAELVVLGRVTAQQFLGDDPADTSPLKDGIWNVHIQIKRILAGQEPRKEIDATLIVHTYLRRDRDFEFALVRGADGRYRVDQSETGCEVNASAQPVR
jgi:hypothetical protein